jgi:hypothetical protein
MSNFYTGLKASVFDLSEDGSLAQIIVATTLALIQDGKCQNLPRVLNKIYNATVGDPETSFPFSTPSFHFSFKVIREAIWSLKV